MSKQNKGKVCISSRELPFCPALPDAGQNIKNADGGIMLFLPVFPPLNTPQI